MSHLTPPQPAASDGRVEPDAEVLDAAAATADATTSAPPAPGKGAWWGRNKLWVRLLLPLLLLAIAATSFRIVRVYLPIVSWSAPQKAQGTTLAFHQPDRVTATKTVPRDVEIRVDSVRPMSGLDDYVAQPGGQLYQVDLHFAASPETRVNVCEVFLTDAAGTLYGTSVGSMPDPTVKYPALPPRSCGPLTDDGLSYRDAVYDDETGELEPPAPEDRRPPAWSRHWSVVLPKDVTPAQVVVRWTEPDYAVLNIPA